MYKKNTASVLLIVAFLAILTGCSEAAQSSEQTILIYMCGSTLETNAGAGTKNIAEILDADIPDDTRVIIQTGGADKWRNYDIDDEAVSRYEIKNGKLNLLEVCQNANLGESKCLEEFISWGTTQYPANKTALVFWNHGAQDVGGVCFDENFDMDGLTLPEIETALEQAKTHFDFIGFDACLMSTYDMVNVVAFYADNMIASEELEPSGGWDYDILVSKYGSKDFYQRFLKGYQDKCKTAGITTYTLSHINFENWNEVQSAFDSFCEDTLASKMDNLQKVVNCAKKSMSFGGDDSRQSGSNLIDLANFSKNLGNTQLSEAMKSCVVNINGKDRKNAGGISLYYPLGSDGLAKDYLTASSSEKYRVLLSKYYSKTDKKKDYIEFADSGSDKSGELYFELSPSSMSYVKSVGYKIFQFIEGKNEVEFNVVSLGIDSDVQRVGKCGFVTSFEGKWVMLDGYFLSCEVIDQTGNTTIFSAPIKCNKQNGTLRFTYNSASKKLLVQGFVPKEKNGAQGRLMDILSGDKISIIQEKIDTNFECSFAQTHTFTVNEPLKLEVKQLPEGMYQFYGIVSDIYGNKYYSSSMVTEYKNGKLSTITISEDVDSSIEQ